ncbi:hypothetical protein IW138_005426 [Coemansia sp. RSA 986]|nr:hypothetical protein IW138_005426 [Coemansia sp. RSA 986]
MPRFWSCSNRRNVALLASAGILSMVGYVLYEIYKESTSDDEPPPSPEQLSPPSLPCSDTESSEGREPVNDIQSKPYLVVSAQEILLFGDMQVRETATAIVKRLASKHNVVLVVRISNEEDKDKALKMLAAHGIVPHSCHIDQSMAWVERTTASSSTDDDDIPSDPPSSAVSSILDAPSSPDSPTTAIIPRTNVLFCQTEEGKQHLVRHLLTLKPQPNPAHTYAGYIDTNKDVASRLAMVLRGPVVLVSNAVSAEDPPLPRNIQIVDDITQSVFFK